MIRELKLLGFFSMNVLVIGSGGREHALAWKASKSSGVTKVYVAPGNAGTNMEHNLENVSLPISDFVGLADFAETNHVGLTIVGPEQPLVDGIVDYFNTRGLAIFGPSSGAAQLEGSKAFTKDFLDRQNIPTAHYGKFTEINPALDYIQKMGAPIVVKADGLAAGKGVIVAMTNAEAETAVRDMLADNVFGEAGSRVVIEEFLEGEEASFIVMVDGKNVLPMATSQDHKRASNGDIGPNTGGMGAYSPAPVVDEKIHNRIMDEVIYPTVRGMAAEGNHYIGFLYAGLMIATDGTPKVIEFNCRFGDPETQPILLRLKSDLVAHCLSALNGSLDQEKTAWDPRSSVGVVLAAGGYPGSYRGGDIITGLSAAVEDENRKVFHAGTKDSGDEVVTAGGRVLCATALGDSVSEAQAQAYQLASKIDWEDMYLRDDIGWRAIAREQSE
jgi:phosphoribosylamine--glycine ligase